MSLPWTGEDTSPAQPRVGPDTPGCQNRTAPTRTGAWTSPRPLGAIAPAGRCGGWRRSSHRRTRRSGTGGTVSVREDPSDFIIVRRRGAGANTYIKYMCQLDNTHLI